MATAELRLDLGPQIRQGVRDYLTRVGLRVQWAALYPEGDWVAGETGSRTEAEEIIASREPTAARLVRRWISDWQPVDDQEAGRA